MLKITTANKISAHGDIYAACRFDIIL